MFVTYSPEGGDVQRWEFLPGRIRSVEATLVEKTYGGGKTWDQFVAEVQSGSMRARRVLLWHLMRRDHHTLRFEDTPDFYADEVKVEHTLDELHAVREQLRQADLPEDQRDQMLALMDADIAAAVARGEQPEGKATSNSAG